MTTQTIHADPWAGHPCPGWCTVYHGDQRPEFPGDDSHSQRTHSGPRFGAYLTGEATEDAATPGVLAYSVALYAGGDGMDATQPSQVLDLATQAIAAAVWLEALQ
jgi:hypothetical protein